MKFTEHTFSKRFPPVECATFVIHESAEEPYRATAAAIILPTGMVYVGVSVCSVNDQFIKSVGREKALGRAFQQLRKNDGNQLMFDGDDGSNAIDDLKELLAEKIALKKKGMGVA
jgi:hypothetical protein